MVRTSLENEFYNFRDSLDQVSNEFYYTIVAITNKGIC